jgi:hypothetical protein
MGGSFQLMKPANAKVLRQQLTWHIQGTPGDQYEGDKVNKTKKGS